MYAEYTRPQLTFLALVPWAHLIFVMLFVAMTQTYFACPSLPHTVLFKMVQN